MHIDHDDLDCLLKARQRTWLITGVAGFIGSNILQRLLLTNQRVVGLDNFVTGLRFNLEDVRNNVSEIQWRNFELIEGDIRSFEACQRILGGIEHVLHQAALGSVPRSLKKPRETHEVNVTGFLNMLLASRDIGIQSFIYASSSSVYGDIGGDQMNEPFIGSQLSPYAVTKRTNELYAEMYSSRVPHKIIGLRYFNVFGPRQSPRGEYSAVIPKWISLMLHKKKITIHGDGKTSRDFCHVENVVRANILASLNAQAAKSKVFNVAMSSQTSLNDLYLLIKRHVNFLGFEYEALPISAEFREGDIRHSMANINRISSELGYKPHMSVDAGLRSTVSWYIKQGETVNGAI